MKKYFALFLLAIVLILAGYELYLVFAPHDLSEVIIRIEQGDTAEEIAEKLAANDVIRSKLCFILYVKITGIDEDLSYGEYFFSERKTIPGVAKKLKQAQVRLYRITIPEGLTIRQTAEIFADKGFISSDIFVSLCSDSLFAYHLTGHNVQTLEGFLYPETYHIPRNASEEYIISTMVAESFKQTRSLEFPSQKGYSFYDTLILASIVEREATFRDEMPLIAGVYHHRLRIGKRLQADPTVAYALAKEGIFRSRIYYVDLEIQSPYNTYRYSGLPPAPICSPSLAAIEAAHNPQDTDYLFFFADRRGRHIFSRTYREHLNKQRALR